MKNKKLGKILLCASLALATPFALVGCGKQAANNENNEDNGQENQQGQQQQQQQENGLAITNAKSYEGAYNTYEKNTYTDAAELKADILAMMSGDYDAPEPADLPVIHPDQPFLPRGGRIQEAQLAFPEPVPENHPGLLPQPRCHTHPLRRVRAVHRGRHQGLQV